MTVKRRSESGPVPEQDPRGEPFFGPQITLQKLEIFCRVAQLMSVTRAAEQIGIAQPAVTAHLRDLESKLGAPLVERWGRNIVLTEAGRRFHRWAREVLTRGAEMHREISGLSTSSGGKAMIAASMTVGSYRLAELLAEFHAAHPHCLIGTRIANARIAADWVRNGVCDLGVVFAPDPQSRDGLVLEPLWEERLLLVAAPGERRVGTTAAPAELAELPFLATPYGMVRREYEDRALAAQGLDGRRVVMEHGHPEAIKRAVRAGTGVSFLEEMAVADEIARGLLRVVDTPGLSLGMPLFLAYDPRKSFSDLQRRVMDFLRAATRGESRDPEPPPRGMSADVPADTPPASV